MLKRLLLTGTLTLLLSGCVPGSIKLADICPTLFPYDAEFQQELAREMEEILDTYPAVAKVIVDNGVTRQQIRSCLRKVGKGVGPASKVVW